MKDKEKVKRGRKSRASGSRFELKVRKDLESKGWICSKWMNNLQDIPDEKVISRIHAGAVGKTRKEMAIQRGYKTFKLIPAKHKFRGPGIPMAIGTGFPDFVAFRPVGEYFRNAIKGIEIYIEDDGVFQGERDLFFVYGVEVKSNGSLDKIEREKCSWYLENNVFSKILIASRGKKRGEIIYKEFEKGGKNDKKI